MRLARCAFARGALALSVRVGAAIGQSPPTHDTSPHQVRSIVVDSNVKLEVLDWGGSGRPIVLLAGQGLTAHGFDTFALKLRDSYHVIGITRRGYGASSAPAATSSNYAADRLGDDVLAVLDSLHLERPVLVGHSLGGEELSSIGSRHPDRVAGLIYLEAGYVYAHYDSSQGDLNNNIDRNEVRRRLEQLEPGRPLPDRLAITRELLQSSLPALERDLRRQLSAFASSPQLLTTHPPPMTPIQRAILAGMQRYTRIPVPILAIYAVPHRRFGADSATRAAEETADSLRTEAQAKSFERGLPSARVVRLHRADHFVYESNEMEVLREIRIFIQSLPVGAHRSR